MVLEEETPGLEATASPYRPMLEQSEATELAPLPPASIELTRKAVPEVAPPRLSAAEIVEKVRSEQDPKYFNETQIRKAVTRGGEAYVKTQVDPSTVKIKDEAKVNPDLAVPDRGQSLLEATAQSSMAAIEHWPRVRWVSRRLQLMYQRRPPR